MIVRMYGVPGFPQYTLSIRRVSPADDHVGHRHH